MFLQPDNTKVYLALGSTDMRKSIDGLSLLVSNQLELDPFSGHLFAFCNRARTIIKILYWDRNGFCLWHKRLEKDSFQWPVTKSEVKAIGTRELAWLMDGLSIHQKSAHKPLNYSSVY